MFDRVANDDIGINTGNLWTWEIVGGLGIRTDSAYQTVGRETFQDDEFGLRHFHSGVLLLLGWILVRSSEPVNSRWSAHTCGQW